MIARTTLRKKIISFLLLSLTAAQPALASIPLESAPTCWQTLKGQYTTFEHFCKDHETAIIIASGVLPFISGILQVINTRVPQGSPLADPNLDPKTVAFYRTLCELVSIDPDTIYLRLNGQYGCYAAIPENRVVFIDPNVAQEITTLLAKQEPTPQDLTGITIHAGLFLHELGHIRNESSTTYSMQKFATLGVVTTLGALASNALINKLGIERYMVKILISLPFTAATIALFNKYRARAEQAADDAIPNDPQILKAVALCFKYNDDIFRKQWGTLYPLYAIKQALFDVHPSLAKRAEKLEARAKEIEEAQGQANTTQTQTQAA